MISCALCRSMRITGGRRKNITRSLIEVLAGFAREASNLMIEK